MYPRLDEFSSYVTKLNSRLKETKLFRLSIASDKTFSYYLKGKDRLVFSFDGSNPSIYIGDSKLINVPSTSSIFFFLRKNISDGIIRNITQVNNDRIISFEIETIDSIYQKITYYLIAELIPTKPNFLILDKDKHIIMVLNPSTLESKRILTRGAIYNPPDNAMDIKDKKDFDIDSFFAFCLDNESKEEERKLLNKYSPYIKQIKSKKKSLERKLIAINKDIEDGNKHINDDEIGNYIFMNMDNINLDCGEFDYYGKKIKLDKKLSLARNAEYYFSSSKKSKEKINKGKENLEKTKAELEEITNLIDFISSLSAPRLATYFSSLDLKKKENKIELPSSKYPYIVEHEGTRYAFGHNASSNDFLTFVYCSNKEYGFFHVKDNHGSHLILEKENPSKKEIELACELSLLSSKLDFGEVIYCKRKDIRKGNKPGEVKLSSYESFYIRKISPLAVSLFNNRKKKL